MEIIIGYLYQIDKLSPKFASISFMNDCYAVSTDREDFMKFKSQEDAREMIRKIEDGEVSVMWRNDKHIYNVITIHKL